MAKEDKTKVLEYWLIVMKYRRILFRNTVVVTLVAVVISLVLVQTFTATATILPPGSDQSAMLGIIAPNISASLSGLSSMSGLLPGLTTPSDLYAAILKSGKIRGAIIKKYDLMKEFKAKTMVDAMKVLDEITRIEVSPEGIISVSVTHRNKHLAADMANSFIEELDKFNTETAMTIGKRYRLFVEKRLHETEDSLVKTETALMEFQETHRTVSLDAEIQSAIEAVAKIKSEIMLREVQKGAIQNFSLLTNPYVINIDQELNELKKQLTRIEFGTKDTIKREFGAGFAVPFNQLPMVALQYARLMRDMKVQETVYELLTQQYEQAKIMELKDTPTVQVLDKASPPEKKSFPHRALIVFFAFFLSVVFNIPLAFILEYLADVKESPEKHKTFIRIREDISNDLRNAKIFLKSRLRKQ